MANSSRPNIQRGFHPKTAFSGSTTSYEDMPDGDSRRAAPPDVLLPSNRHSVMQALQSLQEKIHRLELNRSLAEGDMECLASETARFRRLLNSSAEAAAAVEAEAITNSRPKETDGDGRSLGGTGSSGQSSHLQRCITPSENRSGIPRPVSRTDASVSGAWRGISSVTTNSEAMPLPDFLDQNSTCLDSDSNPVRCSPAPLAPPGPSPSSMPTKAPSNVVAGSKLSTGAAIALTSAETRCSILERQLAYMRTLLEAAERDRNEAQRRTRHKGEEFAQWRRNMEAQLSGLESELARERARARPSAVPEKPPEEAIEEVALAQSATEVTTARIPQRPRSSRVRVCQKTTAATARRASRPAGPPPFVAGKSVTPSHSVNANLQAVMRLLNSRAAAASVALSSTSTPRAARRRIQNDQVDRQLRSDVGVVLEELVDEFDGLCAAHTRCARRLAESLAHREKEALQQELTDLVGRMEVKGQQIGRLRAYMAAIEGEEPTDVAKTAADAAGERRARSLRMLKNARSLQNAGLDKEDLDWR